MTTRRPSRREQILSVAAELFVQWGYRGTSVDALGQAVGISGPALYRHFPSKAAILRQILLATATELADSALAFPRGPTVTEDELAEFVRRQAILSYNRRYELALLDREIGSLGEDFQAQICLLTNAALDASVAVVRRSNPTLSKSDGRTVVRILLALLTDVSENAVNDPDQLAAIERAALGALLAGAPSSR